ncbi:hypothetical protein AMECASPLE_023384 [Ameca splendens]|uniref:Uncharacterized protein n=1 Tax=Ameca splendens TaxID=208324 RepID=A0ABV0ZNX2_9TELE
MPISLPVSPTYGISLQFCLFLAVFTVIHAKPVHDSLFHAKSALVYAWIFFFFAPCFAYLMSACKFLPFYLLKSLNHQTLLSACLHFGLSLKAITFLINSHVYDLCE